MLEKVADFSQNIFYCENCDYTCYKKNDYEKHLLTKKHNAQKCSKKIEIFICNCGKEYKHKQSLNRHKLKCDSNNFIVTKECKKSKDSNEFKDLVCKLIEENNEIKNTILKENTELRKQIGELIPQIGNNNNSHNNSHHHHSCHILPFQPIL